MKLQTFLALLAPFALIALFHHMHFATVSTGQRGMRPAGGMTGVRRRLPVSAQELGKLPFLSELAGGGAADVAQNGAADKSLAAADLVPRIEPRQAVGAAAASSSDGGVTGGAVRASAAAVARPVPGLATCRSTILRPRSRRSVCWTRLRIGCRCRTRRATTRAICGGSRPSPRRASRAAARQTSRLIPRHPTAPRPLHSSA